MCHRIYYILNLFLSLCISSNSGYVPYKLEIQPNFLNSINQFFIQFLKVNNSFAIYANSRMSIPSLSQEPASEPFYGIFKYDPSDIGRVLPRPGRPNYSLSLLRSTSSGLFRNISICISDTITVLDNRSNPKMDIAESLI